MWACERVYQSRKIILITKNYKGHTSVTVYSFRVLFCRFLHMARNKLIDRYFRCDSISWCLVICLKICGVSVYAIFVSKRILSSRLHFQPEQWRNIEHPPNQFHIIFADPSWFAYHNNEMHCTRTCRTSNMFTCFACTLSGFLPNNRLLSIIRSLQFTCRPTYDFIHQVMILHDHDKMDFLWLFFTSIILLIPDGLLIHSVGRFLGIIYCAI